MMNPTRHEDTSPSYINDYLSEERPKRYSSIDLKSFTSDFSERIGYGGFAEVYKGRFPCGELIAVKVLNKSGFVEDTFEAEVRTMGKTAHRNLVKFYGYCFEDNMKALVYEYMENGSLDKILYDNHHGNIELVKLYAIVIDIANVLQYLHHSSPEQIIHHDIKAANVLLDKNFSAKIADFGLARIMNRDVSRVDLSRTRGTPGYIAPEAWRPQSQVTFKCDVYSFGMMLFEVVGKRENGRAEKWFPGLVWSQFENGNLEHFLKDCGIIAEKDKENANILCKIALWCIQENPDLRPSMKDVVLMLEKEKLVKDPPFPPFGFRPFSQMIDMGESGRENIERERSDKIEFDPTYPQIITAGPTNESVAGSDGGVALPQLKSNRRVLRSPIMLERSDKMELDPTYPQNIFAGPSHASVADCSTELDQNLNQLKEKMVQLNALKMDVNNKVNIEEARIMKRTNQVDEWMKRVEATKLEVDRIILEGTQHLERRCLSGCCPKNCWAKRLDKKVVKKLILVEELKRDGVFEIVVENPPLAVVEELPESTPIVGLDSMFDRAWNFLGDNSVRIMGLYGMGGVGKTTLLKRINNELSKRGSDFDIVIWVVISKEVNMARVQEEIGNALGLSLSTTSKIFKVLKTKKFLLLLDDIWQRIDLLSIGVPSPTLENRSKIVFTTRTEDVCGRMEANKIMRVECLNWEASWALFQEKVGYTALSYNSDIPRLAEMVAKECLGLPLALITVGRSMACKKTRHEWEHAITVLKKSTAEFPGMGDEVLPLLKFSYDSLPNDTVRLCFLFCSLYSEDYEIRVELLIEQWIGEGYISGYDNFKEALNNCHDIIGILKGACLLEEVDKKMNSGRVKMHDVIRDLALWIACECGRAKEKYFVKAGVGLIEAPEAGKWPTMAEKISLIDNHITQLENVPKCPNLSTLLVSFNFRLRQIHNDFFLSMPSLRFLDLSFTEIKKLPTSICELVELEFLDLSYTKISSLPYQMRNLTKLKFLFLRNTVFDPCIIPPGIIGNLSNLKFLKLGVFKSVDSEGRFEIDELGCLKQLKTLEISFYSYRKDVEKFLSYPQFANCTSDLSICYCHDITSLSLSTSSSSSSSNLCLGHLKELQYLLIKNCSRMKEMKLSQFGGLYDSLETMMFEKLPKLIISWDARNLHCAHFKKLHFIELIECDAMVNLTWLLLVPNLQSLWIRQCRGLQEILSSSDISRGAYDQNTFSNLKVLYLYALPNLRSICSMSSLPFPSLESIEVAKCPKLRRLPLDSNSANNTLEKIKGEEKWWDSLEWENETIKPHFAKFYIPDYD